MGNACRSFGFDEDEGMRVFSTVEMFIACYHILTASYVFRHIVEQVYDLKNRSDHDSTMMILGVMFMMFLVFQSIVGFLLYLKGWKEKNALVCFIWLFLGTMNNLLSAIICFVEVGHGEVKVWNRLFLYLFYVFFGAWVIISFLKWAKENGVESAICCSCDWKSDPEKGGGQDQPSHWSWSGGTGATTSASTVNSKPSKEGTNKQHDNNKRRASNVAPSVSNKQKKLKPDHHPPPLNARPSVSRSTHSTSSGSQASNQRKRGHI